MKTIGSLNAAARRLCDGGAEVILLASNTMHKLAESALFAWTMIMHPGRLPANVETRAREIMPNRMAFFEELFRARPVFEGTGRKPKC